MLLPDLVNVTLWLLGPSWIKICALAEPEPMTTAQNSSDTHTRLLYMFSSRVFVSWSGTPRYKSCEPSSVADPQQERCHSWLRLGLPKWLTSNQIEGPS